LARIPSKSGSLKDVTKFTKLARLRSLGSRGSAGITDADLLGASFGHGIKAVQTAEGVKLDILARSGTMSFR